MQFEFFESTKQKSFGGDLLQGKRKTARPLSTKLPVHLVFRARQTSLRAKQSEIQGLLNRFARKFGVKIYEFAICTNHIHLLVRIHSRSLYRQFARAFTGSVSRKFKIQWLVRPFTRLLSWGRDFKTARNYVMQNEKEASGEIRYQPRGKSRKPAD